MAEEKALPAVPEYLKKFMAQPAVTEAADSMIGVASVPRISLKAKKFRYNVDGEERFVETETHFVILASEPGKGLNTKTYYKGAYSPGDTAPPTCASSDGIRPDPFVSEPQNDICSTCPQNQFGSATSASGKKTKACRDSKRLWVVRPDEVGDPKATVYGLQVPVTSLKNLSELGQKIKVAGVPMSSVVVKASMFEDESFPIVLFDVAGYLQEQYFLIVQERSSKKDWPGALTAPNPPVEPAKLSHSPMPAGNGATAPVTAQAQSPKTNPDGSIQGQATKVADKGPNVDEVLKTWG